MVLRRVSLVHVRLLRRKSEKLVVTAVQPEASQPPSSSIFSVGSKYCSSDFWLVSSTGEIEVKGGLNEVLWIGARETRGEYKAGCLLDTYPLGGIQSPGGRVGLQFASQECQINAPIPPIISDTLVTGMDQTRGKESACSVHI